VFNLFNNLSFGFTQALIVTRYTSPDTSDLTILPFLPLYSLPENQPNLLGPATLLNLTPSSKRVVHDRSAFHLTFGPQFGVIATIPRFER
jgi:hypothetical protein